MRLTRILLGSIAVLGLTTSAVSSLAQPAVASRQTFRDPSAAAIKAAILALDLEGVRKLANAAGSNDCLELDQQGRTALHYAVKQCTSEVLDPRPFEILKFLASREACVNAPDRVGRRPILELEPLSWTSRSKMDALQILISQGADVNAQDESGSTLLHHLLGTWDASSIHWPSVMGILMKGRLHPNITNSAGETALHLFFGPRGFCSNRDSARATRVPVAQKVFAILVGAGADVSIQNTEGTSPLGVMFAQDEPFFGTQETILAFADPSLSKELKVNSAQIQKRPALISLCDKPQSDPALIERLLDLGADAKVAESDGFTALHGAAWFYNSETCNRLIERGANVNALNNKGRSPLHELARSTYGNSVYLDSDHGADILKAADILIVHGGDRRLKDSGGKTPFDMLKDRKEADPEKLANLRALRKRLKP